MWKCFTGQGNFSCRNPALEAMRDFWWAPLIRRIFYHCGRLRIENPPIEEGYVLLFTVCWCLHGTSAAPFVTMWWYSAGNPAVEYFFFLSNNNSKWEITLSKEMGINITVLDILVLETNHFSYALFGIL